MKKKIFLMTLLLGMGLSLTACTESGSTGQNGENGVETGSEETSIKKEKTKSDKTRIVSVDKIEDYVVIAQYKGIELDSISKEVTDEMVEARISEILEAASTETQGSKATIEKGDVVTANYVATIDGKSFEGGAVTYYDWIVGSGEMLPEFDEAVLGMKRGETKKILCTFPEDYHSDVLAGKEVTFVVNIQAIRRTAKLDDDWVAKNTDVKTVEEYRAVIRGQLEAEIESKVEDELKGIAWEKIVTNSEMLEYPEQDIETAKALYNAQITEYAESYEMNLETFVESQGMTMAEYEEQCQLYAERKVKQNLIVQSILDEEKISLDDEVCMELQNQIMKEYGAESLAELIDKYSQVQIDESIALLRVEDFIYENAVIVEPMAVQPTEAAVESKETEEIEESAKAAENTVEESSVDNKENKSDENNTTEVNEEEKSSEKSEEKTAEEQ